MGAKTVAERAEARIVFFQIRPYLQADNFTSILQHKIDLIIPVTPVKGADAMGEGLIKNMASYSGFKQPPP